MKQMDVFNKIGGILKELNDQYEYLKADSSELNELELELFVANAHFLKDHAEILRRLHERTTPTIQVLPAEKPEHIIEISEPTPLALPEKKQDPIHEQRYFEPVVQQKPAAESKLELTQEAEPPVQAPYNPAKIETTDEHSPVSQTNSEAESTVDSYSFEQLEPEPVKPEPVLDEAQDWDEEDQFEQEELTQQLPLVEETKAIAELPFTAAIPEPEPVIAKADVVVNSTTDNEDKVLTINQKILAQRTAEKETNTSQPANALPITDLKSAINLNDKLLYIKDLFNGYSLAYSEAIEIVNRFNSFEEAERFLKTNYVAKNNWESKPTTSEKFYTLLKRRYPAS